MKLGKLIGTAAGLALLAGCASKPAPAPQAEPPRPTRPAPPLPPQPRPAPANVNWPDLPLTPGNWYYRDEGGASTAAYGAANSEPVFLARCNRAQRQVTLAREGTSATARLVIRTSNGDRTLGAVAQADPLPYLNAVLPASDRFLDAIAFSRGRFAVEAQGLQRLVLPTWPELARVIEDCR